MDILHNDAHIEVDDDGFLWYIDHRQVKEVMDRMTGGNGET